MLELQRRRQELLRWQLLELLQWQMRRGLNQLLRHWLNIKLLEHYLLLLRLNRDRHWLR
jgi:hypothetical protein